MSKGQTVEYFREYRRKNLDRKREIERKSQARPEAKARRRLWDIEYLKKNRDKIYARNRKFREKNKARDKLQYEVNVGRIKRKPCEVCGKLRSDAHHEDYSKPLDVVWLCRQHHLERHRVPDGTPLVRKRV